MFLGCQVLLSLSEGSVECSPYSGAVFWPPTSQLTGAFLVRDLLDQGAQALPWLLSNWPPERGCVTQ